MQILTLKEIKQQISDYEAQLEQIFFLSSSVTNFESEQRKADFFERWLGHYLKHYQATTWCACEGSQILGYLTVCPDTLSFMKERPLESLGLFKRHYESYPAHLHMNTHPSSRGLGIGSQLLTAACTHLKEQGVKGLHLMTSEGERNVQFYQRQGMMVLDQSEFKKSVLLLMGIDLTI